MKRLALIALVCALVGALFVLPAHIVRADSLVVTFEAGGYAYSDPVNGSVAADPLRSGNSFKCTALNGSCTIRINFPSAAHVTYVQMDSLKTFGPPYSLGRGIWLYDAGDNRLSTTFGNSGTYDLLYDQASNYEWPVYPPSADVDVENVAYAIVTLASDYGGDVYMDNIQINFTEQAEATVTPTFTPTSTPDPALLGWNKPLRGSDQRADDVSFHPGRSYITEMTILGYRDAGWPNKYNFNTGRTKAEGVNIFAVIGGTIDLITPATCFLAPAGTPSGDCPLFWDTAEGQAFYIDLRLAYVVKEDYGNGYIQYLVTNPTVAEGDTVQAGCLLGTAPSVVGVLGAYLNEGAAIVQGIDAAQTTSWDVSERLVDEPSGIKCAEAATNYGTCPLVANPNLIPGLGAWQPTYGFPNVPYANPNGLIFPADIMETLSLDSAAQYTITFMYVIEAGAPLQTLNISLGTTSAQEALSQFSFGQVVTHTILPASYTADRDDGLYTLRVSAEQGQADETTLQFICVADSGSEPIADAEQCIVLDPQFSIGTMDSPWYDIASSPAPVFSPGMVELADGADISQAFLLNPKSGGANQDYTLAVTYRRKGVIETGKYVGLEWSSDMVNDGTFADVDSQTWRTATDTISIETDPSTEQLTITAVGSDANQIVQISKVCVTPVEGGTPPGYQPPPPFQGGCRYCVYSPTGDLTTDLSEFQQWLNCQFFQLWECQAKILLRYIWQTLVNILTLLGFLRMWLSATMIGVVNWGGGNIAVFARWLDGTIHNAVQDIVWAILNWHGTSGGGGTNFFDVLIALINGLFSLLTTFVQLVAQIIQLILSGLIGLLVNGVGLILGLLQSLINGMNAGATSIDTSWLPDCTDATSNLFVVCTAISGIEGGLAVGPFALIVPLGLGLAALNLIFWGIRRVLSVFAQ